MSPRPKLFWIFLLFFTLPLFVFAQSFPPGAQAQSRLNTGIHLYSQGRWSEAVLELRRLQAEAATKELRGEALFWISLSELGAGEYEAALRDMDTLAETDPYGFRSRELPYHRGRVLYQLGRYDDAIVFFKRYTDSILPREGEILSSTDTSRKVSAYYWTAECLYSMGQLDRAGDLFRFITEEYPGNPKYEASVYRLAMINQKKVEAELLSLLQWSHEESLKNMEEFRRKESAYDQALSAYQKRIADMLMDTRLQDLEDSNAYFRDQLLLAEERIRSLESSLRETSSGQGTTGASDPVEKLRAMKTSALELENLIRETGR